MNDKSYNENMNYVFSWKVLWQKSNAICLCLDFTIYTHSLSGYKLMTGCSELQLHNSYKDSLHSACSQTSLIDFQYTITDLIESHFRKNIRN